MASNVVGYDAAAAAGGEVSRTASSGAFSTNTFDDTSGSGGPAGTSASDTMDNDLIAVTRALVFATLGLKMLVYMIFFRRGALQKGGGAQERDGFSALFGLSSDVDSQMMSWTGTDWAEFAKDPTNKMAKLNEKDITDGVAINLFHGIKIAALDCKIERLVLSHNSIGDAGAIALAEALKTNASITQVTLHHNSIGDAGAAALADAIKINTTLVDISLLGNSIGASGADALANAMKLNSTITDMWVSDDDDIPDQSRDAIRAAFKRNETAKKYGFDATRYKADPVAVLAPWLCSNTTVKRLHLQFNHIGDPEVAALAPALKSNTSITFIGLSNNSIGDEGATDLANVVESSNTIMGIDLGYNTIGDAGAAALARAVQSNTMVTSISLSHNKIGDLGATALAGALQANPNIKSVDLDNNVIGVVGVNSLADAMESNTTTTCLTLSENIIPWDAQQCNAIQAVLDRNRRVHRFD